MAIDPNNLTDYTAAELLKGCNHAIMHLLAGGQSYSLAGRNYVRADLDKLRAMRRELETEVAESGSTTGTLTALARFGCQQ